MIQDIEKVFTYEKAFKRNEGFIHAGEQKKLRDARVAIAGLGGTGGMQAQALARLGIGNFTLADPDHFEFSNFNRQIGANVQTVGEKKTDVIREMILSVNPEASVTTITEGVTEESIDLFLENTDLVVDSLDFYAAKARFILYRKAREKGLWVINAAPPGFGVTLLVFDPQGMSFEDYFDIHEGMSTEELKIATLLGINPSLLPLQYVDKEYVKAHPESLPCVSPAFFLVAGVTATEAVKILLRKRPVKAVPHVFQFDAILQTYKKYYFPFGMKSPIQQLKKWLIRKKIGSSPAQPPTEADLHKVETSPLNTWDKSKIQEVDPQNLQPLEMTWLKYQWKEKNKRGVAARIFYSIDQKIKTEALEYLDNRADSPDVEHIHQTLDKRNRQFGIYGWFIAELENKAAAILPTLHRPLRIVDIGMGHGGLLVSISKWAKKKGIPVDLTGIDANPNSVRMATKRFEKEKVDIKIIQAEGQSLSMLEKDSFDIALSTFTLHHLASIKNLEGFLKELDRISRFGFLCMDCDRTWYAPLMIWVINTPPIGNDPLLRHDGILSWRRAYRSDEIRYLTNQMNQLGSISPVTIKTQGFFSLFLISEKKKRA